jgi:hypothetical protein
MKKLLFAFAAIAAFTGARAQNIDVINLSPCGVNVNVTAFDPTTSCTVAGGVGPFYLAPAGNPGDRVLGINSTAFPPLPPGWPYPYPPTYAWGEGYVGIPNPSVGYESGAAVGDPGVQQCAPIAPVTTWFNPTCGYTHTIQFIPGSPARLVVN